MLIPLRRKYTVGFKSRNKSTHNDSAKKKKRHSHSSSKPYNREDHVLYVNAATGHAVMRHYEDAHEVLGR